MVSLPICSDIYITILLRFQLRTDREANDLLVIRLSEGGDSQVLPPTRPHRLVVRTPDSHSGNTGSNPVGGTTCFGGQASL